MLLLYEYIGKIAKSDYILINRLGQRLKLNNIKVVIKDSGHYYRVN